jgi:hypothetical protein
LGEAERIPKLKLKRSGLQGYCSDESPSPTKKKKTMTKEGHTERTPASVEQESTSQQKRVEYSENYQSKGRCPHCNLGKTVLNLEQSAII